MKKELIIVISGLLIFGFTSYAQEKLYPNEFPLSDVKLLDGPFKHAQDLNIHVLLEYDVDRLIAPFRKEAGLPEKAKLYPNWAGLDGHLGGHYLSALAMNYASTGNAECKMRMEYMLSELKDCQEANGINNPEWGLWICWWRAQQQTNLEHFAKRRFYSLPRGLGSLVQRT